MLDVCLLGTAGMMPLPNRWLTSLMLRYNGSSILIDCGEGTQIAMKKSGWSPKPIDAILITHLHADHISGLPGLLLSIANADRTEPVKIIGPAGTRHVVESLCVITPELPFEVNVTEIREPFFDISLNGYDIRAFRVKHNVICYGYSVSIRRQGRFDTERAKEKNIPLRLWNPLQKGNTVTFDGKVFTPDMVMGPERKGIKVTYCTDTRPVPVIAEEAYGSDLFICEGMYGDPAKAAKARQYKHMTFYEAAELGRQADPKRMWLTHFSPSLASPKKYIDKVKEIFPRCELGKDGRILELDFEEDG